MMGLRSRPSDRYATLRSIELFADCNRGDLRRVGSLTTKIDVSRGTVLVQEGRIGLEFIVVVRGTATARRDDHLVAAFGPGSFFGELALLDSRVRTATVVADTDMSLLVASRAEFGALRDQVPAIERKVLAEVVRRLRTIDAEVSARRLGAPKPSFVRLRAAEA